MRPTLVILKKPRRSVDVMFFGSASNQYGSPQAEFEMTPPRERETGCTVERETGFTLAAGDQRSCSVGTA